MKSLMQLWKTLASELAEVCCTSATMDFTKVQGRVKHEGLSFLTITLPSFGKDFERSLDRGFVDRDLFQGFSWRAGLPRFLGGFLDRVFDRSSGVLLDDPCIDSILAIRQLTLMFGKILLPCSDARERDAMLQFEECENDVKKRNEELTDEDLHDFHRISRLLFGVAFSEMDRDIRDGYVIPKHGPGATADKLRGNSKFQQSTWTSRLEKVFPFGDHLLPNTSFWDELLAVDIVEPDAEIPVKVISVPKTLKTPRIIAVEPTVMQYMQQGLMAVVLDALSRNDTLDRMIGFDDQVPNQLLALRGSRKGTLATLDLSEASDRVSNLLVKTMLQDFPLLSEAVQATRSYRANVPLYDGARISGTKTIVLEKFASMGSALTFPMEAMVFLTMIFYGIEKELNTRLDLETIESFRGQVRVYGDDIIVPVDYVHSVVAALEHFGAKVNAGKSFWTGKFRESCGKEYYDGHDVSIVRVRRVFPTQRKDAPEIVSLISLRNQLYFAGYWKTVKHLDNTIVKLIRHFPIVAPSSRVQGRHSFLAYQSERTHDSLHIPLVKGYVIDSRLPSNPLDGAGALLKFFLKRSGLPTADEKHLERSGRPQAVYIKLRWAPPY